MHAAPKKRLIFFSLLLVLCLTDTLPAAASPDTGREQGILPEENGPVEGFIYFVDPVQACLRAWPQRFSAELDDHELGLAALNALTAGPPDPSLAAAWPGGTGINALFIGEDGRAWVDIKLPGDGLAGSDTMAEMLAVYSVVNSLALNVSAVKKVKILVNGIDVPSLGGHVSLRCFYKSNMLIVK